MSLPSARLWGSRAALPESQGHNHKQTAITHNQKCYFRLLASVGKNVVSLGPSPTLSSLNKICGSHSSLGLKEARIQARESSHRPSFGELHRAPLVLRLGTARSNLPSPFLFEVNWGIPLSQSLPIFLLHRHTHHPSIQAFSAHVPYTFTVCDEGGQMAVSKNTTLGCWGLA